MGRAVAPADPKGPGRDVEEVVDLLRAAARRLAAGAAVATRRVDDHDVAALGEPLITERSVVGGLRPGAGSGRRPPPDRATSGSVALQTLGGEDRVAADRSGQQAPVVVADLASHHGRAVVTAVQLGRADQV